MISKLKSLVAALALLACAPLAAQAATVQDPTRYDDLMVDVTYDLAGFTVSDLAAGPATLSLRHGLWTGSGGTIIALTATFNDVDLSTVTIDEAYFGAPDGFVASWDVSGLIMNGLNTLSVRGALVSLDSTYAVGPASLDYVTMPTVPLPATAGFVLLGLAGMGFVARKRA